MHTPAEGRKVAGEEEKCTQCKERDLLCAVQVKHSTWFRSKSLSLHCVHLFSFPATFLPSAGVCIHQEIGEGKIIHYNHRRGLTLDDNPR